MDTRIVASPSDAEPLPADSAEEFGVDVLARRAGLPVSTVRLYRTRGLLPPPTKRGRVGFYGPAHLARLEAVGRLRDRGFSLAGIKAVLDGAQEGESLLSLIGLDGSLASWLPEAPQQMTLVELAGQFPTLDLSADVVRRVADLDLIEIHDDGVHVTVRSAEFVRIGRQLLALGFTLDDVLDQFVLLRQQTDAIAERFTELFRQRVWAPRADQGLPADGDDEIVVVLSQLAPLAEAVTVTTLRRSLQAAAEAFLHAESTVGESSPTARPEKRVRR